MDPFIGQISLFSFGGIPKGWLPCNGQILPINGNQALFALLGITFGGDGRTTFCLPDLRGRVAVAATVFNASYNIGRKGGLEGVTLDTNTIPPHNHLVGVVNGAGNQASGLNNHLAGPPASGGTTPPFFAAASNLLSINSTSVSNTGGGAAHNNMQPFLAVTFCIATQGFFPPRT